MFSVNRSPASPVVFRQRLRRVPEEKILPERLNVRLARQAGRGARRSLLLAALLGGLATIAPPPGNFLSFFGSQVALAFWGKSVIDKNAYEAEDR